MTVEKINLLCATRFLRIMRGQADELTIADGTGAGLADLRSSDVVRSTTFHGFAVVFMRLVSIITDWKPP